MRCYGEITVNIGEANVGCTRCYHEVILYRRHWAEILLWYVWS